MVRVTSLIIRSLALVIMGAGLITRPALASPPLADWCQCVIFALNLLGIQQIPGEYWTAASLAVPDSYGKTWMDYQGYRKRVAGETPATGDLLVLSGGAEVVTVQTWGGSEHLVPVPVSAWTGHMGIVLETEKVEKEGNAYIQVRLMSANWGVLAENLGVVGSCYNVDESTFLLPEGYSKAEFFQPVEPVKMRERMVNRANRWGYLSLFASPGAVVDGFPITPSGMISYVLEPVSNQPLVPAETDLSQNLIDIPTEAALAGDIILTGDTNNPAMGVVTEVANNTEENVWNGQVTFLLPGGRVTGPVEWQLSKRENLWFRLIENGLEEKVHFLRYRKLPDHINFADISVSSGKEPQTIEIAFTVSNGGTGQMDNAKILARVYPREAAPTQAVTAPIVEKELTTISALNYLDRENVVQNLKINNPGDYRLILISISPDGVVSPSSAVDFTIP